MTWFHRKEKKREKKETQFVLDALVATYAIDHFHFENVTPL